MFITDVCLPTRFALFAEIPLALIAVVHVLHKTVRATVFVASLTVHLLRELYWFFAKVAHSTLALDQLFVVLPFLCQGLC